MDEQKRERDNKSTRLCYEERIVLWTGNVKRPTDS